MALDDTILDVGAKAVSLLRDTPYARVAEKLDAKWRSFDDKNKDEAKAKVPYGAALHHVVHGGVAFPAALTICGLTINDLEDK